MSKYNNKAVVLVYRGILHNHLSMEFYFSDDKSFKVALTRRLRTTPKSKKLEAQSRIIQQVIYENKDIRLLEEELREKSTWKIKINLYMKEEELKWLKI